MNEGLWALATALTAATMTWIFGVLTLRSQQRHADRAERLALRKDAYARLLGATGALMFTAESLRAFRQVYGGVRGAVGQAVGSLRPLDPLRLAEFMDKDFRAVMEAWSGVWVHGSPEAIALANKLVEQASQVTDTASGPDTRQPQEGPEQRTHLRALAQARKDLADLARLEFGYEAAELFTE